MEVKSIGSAARLPEFNDYSIIKRVIWGEFLNLSVLHFPRLYNEVKEHIGLL